MLNARESEEKGPPARAAILDAAIREFAEHGRDGVRMEKVAVRAGVNKSLVYRYFDNRERLFEEAMGACFQSRFGFLDTLPSDFDKLLKAWAERFRSDQLFMAMMLREALEWNGDEPVQAQSRKVYYAQQVDMVRSLQARGDLPRGIQAEYLFLALLGMLAFPALLPQVTALVTGADSTSDAFARKWHRALTQLAHTFVETE